MNDGIRIFIYMDIDTVIEFRVPCCGPPLFYLIKKYNKFPYIIHVNQNELNHENLNN